MRSRKRFGQHFLHDEQVLERIAQVVGLRADDRVLEIGPGQGALTALLEPLVHGAYAAVEIDRDLVPLLRATYPQMELHNVDVLTFPWREALSDRAPWRLVGNLPYNISSPLILQLVALQRSHPGLIEDAFFMLQKEMAQRMAAQPGSKAWGRLSVMLGTAFGVEMLFDVPPEAFNPPPKVNSCVLRLAPITPPMIDSYAIFERVVASAFSARRKRLANALKKLPVDWAVAGVDPELRADDVSVAGFAALANSISPKQLG